MSDIANQVDDMSLRTQVEYYRIKLSDVSAERDDLLADAVRTVDLITEIMKQDDGQGYMEAMKDSEVVRLRAKIKQLEAQLEQELQENASLRGGSIDDHERGAE